MKTQGGKTFLYHTVFALKINTEKKKSTYEEEIG